MYNNKKNDETNKDAIGELGAIVGSFQKIETTSDELNNPEPRTS